MQTRSQKQITPKEEQVTLDILDKPTKPKKRSALVIEAAPDSDLPPPKERAGRKRTTNPADAAQDTSLSSQKKESRGEATDVSLVLETLPPKK